MRVIAGKLKRRQLLAVPGRQTRPTTDRHRETIFNILSANVENRYVLDLFAGTGALGIEALSRGAKRAVFIDKAPAALKVLKHNIENLQLSDQTSMIRWDIARNLNCLKETAPKFDLVFMDPPYHAHLVCTALAHLDRAQCLHPQALVLAEHTAAEPMDNLPSVCKLVDQRRFGKTLVSFFDYMI